MNDQNFTPLPPNLTPTEKQSETIKVGNNNGGGFQSHPENINKGGRPKRKTLTELIHEKLDNTPEGWEKLATQVLVKIFKDKDKDILKTLWNYTDGMPKQKHEVSGEDGSPIQFAVVGGNGFVPRSPTITTTSAGSAVGQPGTVQGSGVAPKSEENNNGNNGTG